LNVDPAWRSAERFHLSGPSIRLDPRIHAVRRDIADICLADRVFAPHYARPHLCHCALPSAMLHEKPDAAAPAASQLLRGESFAVIDISGGWAWGYGLHDRYVGYVREEALGPVEEPTHVVRAAEALVFAAPDIKSRVIARLPIGARFRGQAQDGFVAGAGGYLHERHVRLLEERDGDPVAVAERLIGAPYLWGGRGAGGIDCSGLVQLAFGLSGISMPRDTDLQRVAIGQEIDAGDPLRRGDLVFFPGHVGMMVDADRLLHANAHWMAVTVEPLADVVARAGGAAGNPILARRRIVS
jgi:hypothetical protein